MQESYGGRGWPSCPPCHLPRSRARKRVRGPGGQHRPLLPLRPWPFATFSSRAFPSSLQGMQMPTKTVTASTVNNKRTHLHVQISRSHLHTEVTMHSSCAVDFKFLVASSPWLRHPLQQVLSSFTLLATSMRNITTVGPPAIRHGECTGLSLPSFISRPRSAKEAQPSHC